MIDDTTRTYEWEQLAADALVTPLHARMSKCRALLSSWRRDRSLRIIQRLDELSFDAALETAFDAVVYAEALILCPLAERTIEWARIVDARTIGDVARELCELATELVHELCAELQSNATTEGKQRVE